MLIGDAGEVVAASEKIRPIARLLTTHAGNEEPEGSIDGAGSCRTNIDQIIGSRGADVEQRIGAERDAVAVVSESVDTAENAVVVILQLRIRAAGVRAAAAGCKSAGTANTGQRAVADNDLRRRRLSRTTINLGESDWRRAL